MSVIVNRPAGCLKRPLPCPRITRQLVTTTATYAQIVQRTTEKVMMTLPKQFVERHGFPEQVPAAPQGKGPRPNYKEEHQAHTTHHAWRSITAFVKAEPDGTIKASVRQAKQVYLVKRTKIK